MARRRLLKELRKLPKTLDGQVLSIGRTITLDDGTVLNPGAEVPASLLAHPRLSSLLKHGYISTGSPVDYRAVTPLSAPPAPPEKAEAPTTKVETPPADEPRLSKAELRARLEDAGVEIPAGASKADLLDLLAALS